MLATGQKPPAGIYIVAIVFFLTAFVCVPALIASVARPFGFNGINIANVYKAIGIGVVAMCLVLYLVWLLTRLHPLPQWLMFAMTVYLLGAAVMSPATGSPFYSASRIYLNRAVLLLPTIGSCIYLITLRRRSV